MSVKVYKWLSIISLVALALLGCQSAQQRRYLEDYVASDYYIVTHREIHALSQCENDAKRSEVKKAIISYLQMKPGHPITVFEESSFGDGRVRARDFWAVFLSNLVGRPLTIYVDETEERKEAKIRVLLESIATVKCEGNALPDRSRPTDHK